MIDDIQIRQFREPDLPAVVEFYNNVFAPLRPFYSWPLTEERFRDKVLNCWEYRPELFRLAFHKNKLVGFALGCRRSEKLTDNDDPKMAAHVSVIAVHPKFRRRGIGRELFSQIEDAARADGQKMLTATCNPMSPMAFFIAPQEDWIDAREFFKAVGCDHTEDDQNFVQSLAGFELAAGVVEKIDQLKTEGYECRACEPRDFDSLMALLGQHEWPFWHVNLASKIGRRSNSRPFIETCFLECSTDDIYGPDEIAVVVKDGQVVSFCVQTISSDTRWAYTGPVLTHSDHRNKGLGYVAVQLSLKIAAEKGTVLCDVWTDADAHHTHFYRKCGFIPMMHWPRFVKKLVDQ